MRSWIQLFCGILFSTIANSQVITTIAGDGSMSNTGNGGLAIDATINYPVGGAFDAIGHYYFAGGVSGNTIRKITPSGYIYRVAGNGTSGFSGDGSAALNAQLSNPQAVIIDSSGNLFIADANNQRIRKVDYLTGVITTIAGNGIAGFSGDGGSALLASFYTPIDICFDNDGNLYIADATNYRIRKIDVTGIITTVVGTGFPGHTGDNGPASMAEIIPTGLCRDFDGNILISDSYSIRKLDVASGIITRVVGTGIGGSNGDGGQATNANVSPGRLTVDKVGNLYFIDAEYHKIRKVDNFDIISTVAGNGVEGFSGDGGLAINAELDDPFGVCVDSCGNLFIADGHNRRIRKVSFNPNCWPLDVDVVKPLSFSVSPNPTSGYITIHSGSKLQEIALYNSLGQQMLQAAPTGERTGIDISSLAPGFYFVTVTDVNGMRLSRKLLKE